MKTLLILAILVTLSSSGLSLDIEAKEKIPPCNPVPEDAELILKVATTTIWDRCFWYKEDQIVCKQLGNAAEPGETIHKCDTTNNETSTGRPTTRSSSLSGGPIDRRQKCELHINNIEAWDTGNWMVKIDGGASEAGGAEESFVVVVNQPSEMEFQIEEEVKTNHTMVQNTRLSLKCIAAEGMPRPGRFNWTINGDSSFYRTWTAITYPLDYPLATTDFDYVNVTQTMELVPPSPGTYQIQCIAFQDDTGYNRAANLTLIVQSEDEAANGERILSTGWIIGISVSCGLLFLLIVCCCIAFCCGLCCFKKNDNKHDKNRRENQNQNNRQQQNARQAMAQPRETGSVKNPHVEQPGIQRSVEGYQMSSAKNGPYINYRQNESYTNQSFYNQSNTYSREPKNLETRYGRNWNEDDARHRYDLPPDAMNSKPEIPPRYNGQQPEVGYSSRSYTNSLQMRSRQGRQASKESSDGVLV